MRTSALLMATVLLTAGLAGCLGLGGGDDAQTASTDDVPQADTNESEATDNETEIEEPAGPQPEVHWFNGSVQGGSLVATNYCAPGCDNVFEFPVENGSTGIVVEMTWESDGGVSLYASAPFEHCESSDPVGLTADCPERGEDTEGDAPARIEILDERTELEGDWSAQAFPHDSYAESTPVTIVISVFYDETPPPQFTKLDPAEGP